VRVNGKESARPILEGQFTFKVDTGQDCTESVVVIEADAQYRSECDHRRLGIFLTGIVESRGEASIEIAVTNDFEVFMRRYHPDEWVASLVQIARTRPIEADNLFQEIRGPHSEGLIGFLQQNAYEYDAVLVQGIPFSTAVIATKAVKESGTPVILLPHFHMEDRYYHWRAYYEAFVAADTVLTFPGAVKKQVMDRLGAKAFCIPGGGVNPDEFAKSKAHAIQFCSAHRHKRDRPFVLVLGRKAGSKNYRTVIEAIELLNANGPVVDLVMIGPDEDGVAIKADSVTYLGSQPRDTVLGALASCLCVVNMSESESFGIVIVEAWMCGRPVIVNRDCTAFSELVEHERDGFLCRSPEEVAFCIDRLRQNSALQDALGETGKQKAIAKYTWVGIAALVNHELRQMVDHEAIASQTA
jgi:glycosyltransferase involved in cell wall biosynthesis